ncbi:hypothetical protein ACQPW3_36380 [Actinosynnema sp. CA-248983]
MPYYVTDRNGHQVREGDEVRDFRGTPAKFLRVTRGTEYNGTARVEVEYLDGWKQDLYAEVFDLEIRTISEWVAAQDRSAITDENVDELMEMANVSIDYWAVPNGSKLLGPRDQTPPWACWTVVEKDTGLPCHLSRDDIRFAFLALAEPGQKLTYPRIGERFRLAWVSRGGHGIEVAALDPVSGDVVTQLACFGEIRH